MLVGMPFGFETPARPPSTPDDSGELDREPPPPPGAGPSAELPAPGAIPSEDPGPPGNAGVLVSTVGPWARAWPASTKPVSINNAHRRGTDRSMTREAILALVGSIGIPAFRLSSGTGSTRRTSTQWDPSAHSLSSQRPLPSGIGFPRLNPEVLVLPDHPLNLAGSDRSASVAWLAGAGRLTERCREKSTRGVGLGIAGRSRGVTAW
jgi:hypothetical protein